MAEDKPNDSFEQGLKEILTAGGDSDQYSSKRAAISSRNKPRIETTLALNGNSKNALQKILFLLVRICAGCVALFLLYMFASKISSL